MVPRLKSQLQVAALQRQAEGLGLMFAVLDRGHDEGGLIYIKWVTGRDAQLFSERTVGDERRWVLIGEGAEAEINLKLSGEKDFDPDLWAVEILGDKAHVERLLHPLTDY